MKLLFLLFAFNSFASIQTPTLSDFSISESGTNWEATPAPPDSESIKALFRSKLSDNNTQATLTARTELLEHGEKDLKDYVRRWLKEYPKFGYNVLGQKPFTLDGKPAYVVDLLSTTTDKQARQILSENNKTIVLLTCIDSKDHFDKSLPACNTIIRNFKWK